MVNRITVLYDNRAFDDLTADWGFSAFLEGPNVQFLFDTGANPEILNDNAQRLGIDLSQIESVFISHTHWDHVGGLQALKPLEVFLPEHFNTESAVVVLSPTILGEGLITTGAMETGLESPKYEHSLIAKTPDGFVLITGCSHPGIVTIAERAVKLIKEELFLIIGGFHLYKIPDPIGIIHELQNYTQYVAPCHCTGDVAIELFKLIFKERFINTKAGLELNFGGK